MSSYSLYLIGSQATGSATALSDLDYVCLYDDKRPDCPEFMQPHCNVSFYNPKRLMWMIDNSKLFIEHILRDGKKITATTEHERILRSYKIKKNILRSDLADFRKMACDIEWVPSNQNGLLWAADYVYCLARNIIFISNALEDIFEFNFEKATQIFLDKRDAIKEMSDFLSLRHGKYQYRSPPSSSLIDVSKLPINLNVVLSRITDESIRINLGGKTSFESLSAVSYETLRLVERAIINLEIFDRYFLERLKNHSQYGFDLRLRAKNLVSMAVKNERDLLLESS